MRGSRIGLAVAGLAVALLAIATPAGAADGIWTGLAGDWTDTGNWAGGVVAGGADAVADFNTMDIPKGDHAVALDAPVIIGNLRLGDLPLDGYSVDKSGVWVINNGGNAANTLTLEGASPSIYVGDPTPWNWVRTRIHAQIAGTSGLTVDGPGILELRPAAANPLTGTTTINGGTLILGFNDTSSPVDILDGTSPLVMNGGRLQVDGKWGLTTIQNFAGTTISGVVEIVANTGGGTAVATDLNLGALTRNGGFANFTVPTSGSITSTTTGVGGILGTWTTTGSGTGLQYAANGGGSIATYTGATLADPDLANVTSATTNYELAVGATIADGAALTGNTLRHTGGASVLEIGGATGNTTTLTLNGIMQAGTNTLTIQDTSPDPAEGDPIPAAGGLVIGSGNDLAIVAINKKVFISAPIKDGAGGAGTVTYSGADVNQPLDLRGLNTYSGGTTVASGQLSVAGAEASGSESPLGTGTVTLMPGTVLQLSRNSETSSIANDLNVTDATIRTGNSHGSVVSGDMVVSGTVTIMHNSGQGNIDYTGDISGPGGLLSYGSRETQQLGAELFGTNTYAGATIVGANGNLGFASRLSLPNAGSWTADTLVVQEGGTAYFYVGQADDFTVADIDALKTLGTDDGGFLDGSYLGFFMADDFAYAGVIADTNAGANSVGLRKHGDGALTLGGDNTYTGQTIIRKGTVIVSSINSVVGGTVSSSFGTPATPEDGTITLGGSYRSAQITYVGTGETTDRVLKSISVMWDTTIDQSGSGLLKFTADMDYSTQGRTLFLKGSTDGEGEFAGTISGNPNPSKPNKVRKQGTGKWTLSGTSAYTGTTAVEGGTLVVTGSIADSDVTVSNAGSMIAGGGTVKSLNVNAGTGYTWGYGDGADHVMNVVGDLTLADDWVIKLVDLGDDPTAGEQYDLVAFGGVYDGAASYSGALANIVIDATEAPDWDISGLSIVDAGTRLYITGIGSTASMGDANGDGWIDDDDLSLLLANWQKDTDWGHGEFSGEAPVDDDDLSLLLANWTGGPPAGITVPEPTALAILVLGALGLLGRRRK